MSVHAVAMVHSVKTHRCKCCCISSICSVFRIRVMFLLQIFTWSREDALEYAHVPLSDGAGFLCQINTVSKRANYAYSKL